MRIIDVNGRLIVSLMGSTVSMLHMTVLLLPTKATGLSIPAIPPTVKLLRLLMLVLLTDLQAMVPLLPRLTVHLVTTHLHHLMVSLRLRRMVEQPMVLLQRLLTDQLMESLQFLPMLDRMALHKLMDHLMAHQLTVSLPLLLTALT